MKKRKRSCRYLNRVDALYASSMPLPLTYPLTPPTFSLAKHTWYAYSARDNGVIIPTARTWQCRYATGYTALYAIQGMKRIEYFLAEIPVDIQPEPAATANNFHYRSRRQLCLNAVR